MPASQIAAEQLAEQVGSFPFSYGPARTIAVTEGMLTAAFRRALDAGLIAIKDRAPGNAEGTLKQYQETGDSAFLDNADADELREMVKTLAQRVASAQELIGPTLSSLADAPELRSDANALLCAFAEWEDKKYVACVVPARVRVRDFAVEHAPLSYVGVALLREVGRRLRGGRA